jgi:hypothetical protein
MATKSKKVNSDQFPRDLNPRNPDTKYLGNEPLFVVQPETAFRQSAMALSFNWYNQFFDKKTAKEMLAEYCEHVEQDEAAKHIRKVPESEILATYGWLGRMVRRGLELTESEQQRLDNEINRLKNTLTRSVVVDDGESQPESRRPNIQEIMRDKAREAAGELEGLFDEYYVNGMKNIDRFKPIDEVAKFNVMPQHINIILNKWQQRLDEYNELLDTRDRELLQAYGMLSKTEIKAVIKFIELVIADLNGYVSVKKASKAPRAKKAVPVEKIVRGLKYLKEFKDDATKLNLVSVHPTKVHGAQEMWVYDTAKRKLHHYIADEYSKSFTVKGNTILGFCKTNSEIKTLRKPAEAIKEIMGSKPAARKYFKDIKAVATVPNGRFNESMIILKAF